ncbi:MAG: P-II family nitrogen regulator, partial [Thermoleophilaceae bacterium]|nr:P-II family nitrogen regulator [Thermoleophilaceae bacterium]
MWAGVAGALGSFASPALAPTGSATRQARAAAVRAEATGGGLYRAASDRGASLARSVEGSRTVKLVIGIVRPEKANDVLEALYRAEVRGLSISRVQGHGGELDRVETYRGTTVKMGLS